MAHRVTYTSTPRRELISQECLYNCKYRTDPVPQLSTLKFLTKRIGLPGVLTHRLAGQIRYSQRQEDQLTTEITRW